MASLIPGEILTVEGDIELNVGRPVVTIQVVNTGDRPIQVGSHYHFAETNPALAFDRAAAHGFRLDIAAGTAVRFEPGQGRTVDLVALDGTREVYGFRQQVMGKLGKVRGGVGSAAPAKGGGARAAQAPKRGGTTSAPNSTTAVATPTRSAPSKSASKTPNRTASKTPNKTASKTPGKTPSRTPRKAATRST